MMNQNNPSPDPTTTSNAPTTDESNDPKSGENDSPDAITGAVEAGWNGSVAGTNDALEPDENTKESQ